MTPDPMIERAIAAVLDSNPTGEYSFREFLMEADMPSERQCRTAAKSLVCAVLTAMREPTKAMVTAGRWEIARAKDAGMIPTDETVARCLTAMIDAALAETQSLPVRKPQ